MAESRRSFFASAASWLASLPVLSAWLARPAVICVKLDDDGEGEIGFPTEFAKSMADIRETSASLLTGEYCIIRWIPVTERLPEDVAGGWSKRVMLVMSDGGICFGHLIHVDPESRYRGEVIAEYGNPHWSVSDEGFSEKISAVTHWAELPAPPATEGQL